MNGEAPSANRQTVCLGSAKIRIARASITCSATAGTARYIACLAPK